MGYGWASSGWVCLPALFSLCVSSSVVLFFLMLFSWRQRRLVWSGCCQKQISGWQSLPDVSTFHEKRESGMAHRNDTSLAMAFIRLSTLLFLLLCAEYAKAFVPSLPIGNIHLSPSLLTTSQLFMGQRGKRIRKEKRRARKEPTPPRIQTPYGPIRFNKPPRRCETCQGRGIVRCHVCEGRGVVRKTGTTKRNIVDPNKVVGSQWSSVAIREGHRHYRVVEMKGSAKKKTAELRMGNCCGDPITFWIPLEELRNKNVWRKGWVTLEDIHLADRGDLPDIATCFLCKGERVLQCLDCGGAGMIESYEPLHD